MDGRRSTLRCALARGSLPPAGSTRGLAAPLLCIIDGNPGLRRVVSQVWPTAAVQRCCVHKLRNLERKAPRHALVDLRDDVPTFAHRKTTSSRSTRSGMSISTTSKGTHGQSSRLTEIAAEKTSTPECGR